MTESQAEELITQLKAINENLGRIAEALQPPIIVLPLRPQQSFAVEVAEEAVTMLQARLSQAINRLADVQHISKAER